MNVCGLPFPAFLTNFKGNHALGRIWLKPNCFKCNFICSQVLWKSLHWNLFCSSPLFHFPARKLLFGSILGVISVSFSLFPPVNAMPSKIGFTPHVLRDGGCFHFYPLLNGKNSATDILRTDECDWGWLVAKSEAMSERTERRVKRTGCAVKEPKVTAFLSVWVEAADATNSSPNKDFHWLVLQDFFFFFFKKLLKFIL